MNKNTATVGAVAGGLGIAIAAAFGAAALAVAGIAYAVASYANAPVGDGVDPGADGGVGAGGKRGAADAPEAEDVLSVAYIDDAGRLVYKATNTRLPYFNRGSALEGKQFVGKEELPDGLIVYRAWDPNTRQLEQIQRPSSAVLARQRKAYGEEQRAQQDQVDAETESANDADDVEFGGLRRRDLEAGATTLSSLKNSLTAGGGGE